jgi:hypothetical protein
MTEVCQRCGYTIAEHSIFHDRAIPEGYQEGKFTFDSKGFVAPFQVDQVERPSDDNIYRRRCE